MKDLSFTFIELPKFNKQNGTLQGIDKWCDLFKNATNSESPNTTDPIIKKAYEILEMSTWTEKELLAYQASENIRLDIQVREDQVREEATMKVREETEIEIAKIREENTMKIAKVREETTMKVREENTMKIAEIAKNLREGIK